MLLKVFSFLLYFKKEVSIMTNTAILRPRAFKQQKASVRIPNCAINELSLSALGFYGTILDMVQNSNTIFHNKTEVIARLLECTPKASRNSAERAWNELVTKGYIKRLVDEAGETIEVTYGPQGRIGEQ